MAAHLTSGADGSGRAPVKCACEGGVLRGIRETHIVLQLAHIMSQPEHRLRLVVIGGGHGLGAGGIDLGVVQQHRTAPQPQQRSRHGQAARPGWSSLTSSAASG